jgi:HEAT repeat protein
LRCNTWFNQQQNEGDVKRRSKIILVAGLIVAGGLFCLNFPPSRQALARRLVEKGPESLKSWGLKVLAEARLARDVELLVKTLSSDNSKVREHAVNALGEMGELAAASSQDLVPLCRDKENVVSKAAAQALLKMGAAGVPGVASRLSDENPLFRQAAASVLLNLGEKASGARSQLIHALIDKNTGVQILAILALEKLPEGELAIPPLLKTFKIAGNGGPVRAAAARALKSLILRPGYLESQETVAEDQAELVVPHFMALIGRKDPSKKIFAAAMLGKLGYPGQIAIPELLRACLSKDESVRLSALIAIEKICRPVPEGLEQPLLKLFRRSLKEKKPEFRKTALRGLTIKRLDPSGRTRIAAMVPLLNDSDTGVKAEAIRALALGGQDSVGILVKLLDTRSKSEQERVALALALIGKGALPGLRLALQSKAQGRRLGAARALAMMEKEGLPTLILALGNWSAESRQAAIWGLVLAGPVAVPQVLELIDKGEKQAFVILQLLGEQAFGATERLSLELQNTASPFHTQSLQSLGKIGVAAVKAVVVVLPFLKHSDPILRRDAADALGAISLKDENVINALEYARGDKVSFVRTAAADAVNAIKERPAKTTEKGKEAKNCD